MDWAADNSGIIEILEESKNQTSQAEQSLFAAKRHGEEDAPADSP